MAASADRFPALIGPLLDKEGGGTLTNNPADRGGATIWGITEQRAREAGFAGTMAQMTRDQAVAIYRLFYWCQPGFDQLEGMLPGLGALLFQLGVNIGTSTAGKYLQRALNAFNLSGADLKLDGGCGAMTRAALSSYLAARKAQHGDQVLLSLIRAFAAVHYVEIAEGDRTQRQFEFGWQLARAFELA